MSATGWGGKRQGAGRPIEDRTLLAQQMRDRFVELCYEKSEEIFDALVTAALGNYRVEKSSGVNIRIYTKSPDVSALREVCNRIWGHPTATVDFPAQTRLAVDDESLNSSEFELLTREYEEKLKKILLK